MLYPLSYAGNCSCGLLFHDGAAGEASTANRPLGRVVDAGPSPATTISGDDGRPRFLGRPRCWWSGIVGLPVQGQGTAMRLHGRPRPWAGPSIRQAG